MAGPVPEVAGYTDLVRLGGGGAGESFAARREERGLAALSQRRPS